MAVFAPSLAAVTAWFAPFPPQQIASLCPQRVSPTLGSFAT